jgi:DNA mismatch repair protein MutS
MAPFSGTVVPASGAVPPDFNGILPAVSVADSPAGEIANRTSHIAVPSGEIQLSLFQLDDPLLADLRRRLDAIDLLTLTPLGAFDALRDLKKALSASGS